MIAALLLTTALAADAQAADRLTQAQAIELAEQRKREEALGAFRKLAAENPRDHEARLWIARMHAEMGHPELAEPVYRAVMMENPQSVPALVGLGNTLVSLNAPDDAIVVLEKAVKLEPENQEATSALRRAQKSRSLMRLIRLGF